VRELLAAGHAVTVMHRDARRRLPDGVEGLIADRNDGEAVARVLAGRRFDAVFDNVYDWERGTSGEQVAATARACGDVSRYVFLSSIAAYGHGLDRREDEPLAPDDFADPYCRAKAMSERALFRLHRERGLPVATLRPPFVYGPENPFYREAFFWDRMRDGRAIVLPGDGSRLMQFVYVKDLVRALIAAMREPAAAGEACNIGDARAVTQAELVAALGRAAGVEPRTVNVERAKIEAAGGNPMGDPMYFGVYFDLPPITEAMGKAERLLGVAATPFDQGLRETYEWYRESGARRDPDYAFEDALMRE
jgi:nucleoside-diphosphate-sugar epimerase